MQFLHGSFRQPLATFGPILEKFFGYTEFPEANDNEESSLMAVVGPLRFHALVCNTWLIVSMSTKPWQP